MNRCCTKPFTAAYEKLMSTPRANNLLGNIISFALEFCFTGKVFLGKRCMKAEEEAEEDAESVSASLGGSEDERSSLSGERAAQGAEDPVFAVRSALLAQNFEPKRCLASLTSAARHGCFLQMDIVLSQ
ncbi:hypothetical protein AK812_SmicGene15728 [Symbiodinium microadriaticum]|uniref:Uncharacterized protein n=1 Tax=Symbiodinium microadriaticum TaxID=2951 RepID=A0A1Q9E276_SYMMI|nr:hypothetical protein AK812_SmicGene15728 [Symbiodinium microadriaticum]